MNFVYLCRDGDNEELRYSIRSVYEHIESPNIWVIGGKPAWYLGNYLHVAQDKTKYENVRNNTRTLLESEEIPENIVLMNDDFFIMQDLQEIPVIHGGVLRNKIDRYKKIVGTSKYTQILIKTDRELKKQGIEKPIDYEMHVPMPIVRSKLKTYPEFAMRTMYGNLNSIGGTEIKDVKVYNAESIEKGAASHDYMNSNSPFISSSDASFKELYFGILKNSLNKKSPIER